MCIITRVIIIIQIKKHYKHNKTGFFFLNFLTHRNTALSGRDQRQPESEH